MITTQKKKYILVFIITSSILVTSFSYYLYQSFFTPNAHAEGESPTYLHIAKGGSARPVSDRLFHKANVSHMLSSSVVAPGMGPREDHQPGTCDRGPLVTNPQWARLLRPGRQPPLHPACSPGRPAERL